MIGRTTSAHSHPETVSHSRSQKLLEGVLGSPSSELEGNLHSLDLKACGDGATSRNPVKNISLNTRKSFGVFGYVQGMSQSHVETPGIPGLMITASRASAGSSAQHETEALLVRNEERRQNAAAGSGRMYFMGGPLHAEHY